MPVRYIIDKERRLVTTSASGCVTFAELKEHQDRLLSDPDFDPTFNQLGACAEDIRAQLSSEEIITLARRKLFSSTSRRAFVVPKPEIYGLARMFETYHEMSDTPSRIRAFRDLDSALRWLERGLAAKAS